MTIITDQQGRILYYPRRDSFKAYLVPSKERADKIEKNDAVDSFVSFFIFISSFVFMLFFLSDHQELNLLKELNSCLTTENYNICFLDIFFLNIPNYPILSSLGASLILTFIIKNLLIDSLRIKHITGDLYVIPRSESIGPISQSKDLIIIISEFVLAFPFYKYILLPTTKIFIIGFYFIFTEPDELFFPYAHYYVISSIFFSYIYYLFLREIIINLIITYYKIRQSWGKSKQ